MAEKVVSVRTNSNRGGKAMLTRWSDIDRMFKTINLLRNSIDGLSSEFDRSYRWNAGWPGEESIPKTNIYDRGGKFEVYAEVPGFSKEDLSIKVQGNYLELSGTRKSLIPEGYTVHRIERKSATFSRSFTLGADIDAERVEATLRNGILRLSLPKSEAAVPRQITIG
jgi:HSP20 family protein